MLMESLRCDVDARYNRSSWTGRKMKEGGRWVWKV